MKIEFTTLTKLDYDEARNYYEKESVTLANRFKSDIKQSMKLIQSFPNLYPKIDNRVQKCVIAKFPYTIFYTIKNDIIYILAIANHYKNPISYLDRFNS